MLGDLDFGGSDGGVCNMNIYFSVFNYFDMEICSGYPKRVHVTLGSYYGSKTVVQNLYVTDSILTYLN